jgi:murein DD-endopeptidase MepM/ murein hydrolase activator NlpD
MRAVALGLAAVALAGAAPADLVPHKAAKAAKPTPAAKQTSKPKPPRPEDETEHLVTDGETLGGIAARAKIPRILIAEANGLKPPYAVRPGQRLLLPRTRHHTVKEGETGFDIAMHYGVPFQAIAVANGLDRKSMLKPGQKLLIPTVLTAPAPAPAATATPDPRAGAEAEKATRAAARAATRAAAHATEAAPDFGWPLAGKVVRTYTARDQRNYHDGIDILAPEGAPVRASAGGKVIFAGEEPQSFGRLVVLDHGNGWQSAYGFLSKVTVRQGDTVKPHERLGLVGHSGKAPRDQLHFELRRANRPTDPVDQLPDAPKPKAG